MPNIGNDLGDIENALKRLFEQILGKDSLNVISKYLITEDDNYKSVVNSINKNSRVSDNANIVGIAKTIFNPEENKSIIIIKNHQIIPLIHGMNSQLPLESWTNEQLDALYTTLHEVGHGIDNFKRPQMEIEKLKLSDQFEVICDYYHSVILKEIGANLCVTKFIPSIIKLSGRGMLIKHINTSHFELTEFCKNNRGQILGQIDSLKLISLIAIVLLKIQEVYIHRAEKNEDICEYFSDDVQSLIKKWIQKLENSYPNCKSSRNIFFKIFQNILEEFKLERIEINNEERIKNCV